MDVNLSKISGQRHDSSRWHLKSFSWQRTPVAVEKIVGDCKDVLRKAAVVVDIKSIQRIEIGKRITSIYKVLLPF